MQEGRQSPRESPGAKRVFQTARPIPPPTTIERILRMNRVRSTAPWPDASAENEQAEGRRSPPNEVRPGPDRGVPRASGGAVCLNGSFPGKLAIQPPTQAMFHARRAPP